MQDQIESFHILLYSHLDKSVLVDRVSSALPKARWLKDRPGEPMLDFASPAKDIDDLMNTLESIDMGNIPFLFCIYGEVASAFVFKGIQQESAENIFRIVGRSLYGSHYDKLKFT
jgi:hypothetical protein